MFYAVVEGRKPGIYHDWVSTKAQVDGYPRAVFKSFKTMEEAQRFYQEHTVVTPSTAVVAYTDGSSINVGGQYYGSYAFIIVRDGQCTRHSGRVPYAANSYIAELYAIYACLWTCPESMTIHTDCHSAITTLTSYYKPGADQLVDAIKALMLRRNVKFVHVPGHSGVPLNEECDSMARAALGI